MAQPKKCRKRRNVKNGFVDVDDISEEAGKNCINWKVPAITKLKQREWRILQHKGREIIGICNKVCAKFVTYDYMCTYCTTLIDTHEQ